MEKLSPQVRIFAIIAVLVAVGGGLFVFTSGRGSAAAKAQQLRDLAPDFAGFRSAVCAGHRSAALDPQRLQALVSLMQARSAAIDVNV